jgi:glycosyltransferase involved in cell wall biosynthesis
MKHLSVFLPFHNEEGNIEAAVKAVLGALWQIPEIEEFEVIIVDDGSTDRTKEIALEIVRENAQVRLVSHDTNRGYGAAIMSGFNDARFEYVFFTDGDLQFDISELRDFLPWVPEYGAVIGYRVKRQDNLQRRINTFLWNRFIRAMFGLKVRDIDCAFKLFKTDLVADLPMISGGAMFSAELLIRLKKSGVRFKEIPVTHLSRLHGSSSGAKPHVIMKAFRECAKVRRDLRRALQSS